MLDCTCGDEAEGTNHMGFSDDVIMRDRLRENGNVDDSTKLVITHSSHNGHLLHEELEKLIERSANVLGVNLDTGSAHELALRSRGTPRIANRLLRRVRDWAIVHDLIVVRPDDVKEALALYQIDSEGLDRLDIAVLNAIVRNFNGGPVGLNNLAAMVGEESETVETVCEPYLVREGFMIRTPKGRVATEKAWQHLGITPKDDVSKLF